MVRRAYIYTRLPSSLPIPSYKSAMLEKLLQYTDAHHTMSNAPYQALATDELSSTSRPTSPSSPSYPPAQHPGPSKRSAGGSPQWRHFRPIYLVPAAALALMAVAVLTKHSSIADMANKLVRPHSVLKYKEGLAYVPDDEEWRGDHPIIELMERAKRLKREMDQTREMTQTLEGAVRDYEAAFGMRPPEGFEKWYVIS